MPSVTFGYKSAFVHVSDLLGPEKIMVQDVNFKLHGPFKSVLSAKSFITRKLTKPKDTK